MLRVVSVVDKKGTALDRLSQGVAPYHDNLDYFVCDVHPKRPSVEQLEKFLNLAQQADIIEYQYYRSAEMLRNNYPWLKEIPSILVHNNPYAITEGNWNDYQYVVGNNKEIFKKLGDITKAPVAHIPLAVDHTFWRYNQGYRGDRTIIMVANRIESKKGILPVAVAAAEVGAKFILVGAISDPSYFAAIQATGIVQFHEQIEDEMLRELYYQSGIHVCNSVDGFESGTLPVLEAAFCGIPILSRLVGHVPEIYDGENMVIHDGDPEASEKIAELLDDMFNDKKKLETLRQKAWNSVKGFNNERRAYRYQQLYREVLSLDPTVSVIMPVANNPDITRATLQSIANQKYKNIELIVIDDGHESSEKVVKEFGQYVNFPVRYRKTDNPAKYNLAQARNIGIIEATGDLLVFVDQRMELEPDAITEFVAHAQPRTWLYGSKGAKKDFIENFSCIYRSDIIQMGMFNERITEYGGMSQECRSRARAQRIETKYVESAKATPSRKSSNRSRKKDEIIRMKNLLFKLDLN